MQGRFSRMTMKQTHSFCQQASTEWLVLGVDPEGRLFCPQSLAFLNARATKNFSFFPPLFRSAVDSFRLQPWSTGNLCFRQTFDWQFLHVLVFEKVSISLHRFTGQTGFFLFLESQSWELLCFSNTTFSSSSPLSPVISIDVEQVSHTTTFLLLRSEFGHLCNLYDMCSLQNTWKIWISQSINQTKAT